MTHFPLVSQKQMIICQLMMNLERVFGKYPIITAFIFQISFAVVDLTTFGKIVAYFLDHLGEVHNEHFELLYLL